MTWRSGVLMLFIELLENVLCKVTSPKHLDAKPNISHISHLLFGNLPRTDFVQQEGAATGSSGNI